MTDDWSTAPEWAEWCVTLDFNGVYRKGVFSEEEPTLDEDGTDWEEPNGRFEVTREPIWPGSDAPWRESKRRRPTEEPS